jgi:hypothetical protein
VDPFHVRRVNDDDMVEEVDMSDQLLKKLEADGIDALIAAYQAEKDAIDATYAAGVTLSRLAIIDAR